VEHHRSLVKNRYKRAILDFGQLFDKKPNEINDLRGLALGGGCKAWVYIHVKRGFTCLESVILHCVTSGLT